MCIRDRLLPHNQVEPAAVAPMGTFLSGEDDGKDCKDRGPQESDGHVEEHRLSEMQQAYSDRETGEGPRTRHTRRDLYLVLCLRFFLKICNLLAGSSSRA